MSNRRDFEPAPETRQRRAEATRLSAQHHDAANGTGPVPQQDDVPLIALALARVRARAIFAAGNARP